MAGLTAFRDVVVTTAVRVGDAVATAAKVAVAAIAEGIAVVVESAGAALVAVLEAVVAVGQFIVEVAKKIGSVIVMIVNFLMALFKFRDIVHTARAIRGHVQGLFSFVKDDVIARIPRLPGDGLRRAADALRSIKTAKFDPTGGAYEAIEKLGSFYEYIPKLVMKHVRKLVEGAMSGAVRTLLGALNVDQRARDAIRKAEDVMRRVGDGVERVRRGIERFPRVSPFATFDTVLDVLGDALEGLPDILDGVKWSVHAGLSVVLAALDERIKIPIVTWIWETITGSKLSLLNVLCFMVGGPFTVVWKIFHSGSRPFGGGGAGVQLPSVGDFGGVTAGIGSALGGAMGRRQHRQRRCDPPPSVADAKATAKVRIAIDFLNNFVTLIADTLLGMDKDLDAFGYILNLVGFVLGTPWELFDQLDDPAGCHRRSVAIVTVVGWFLSAIPAGLGLVIKIKGAGLEAAAQAVDVFVALSNFILVSVKTGYSERALAQEGDDSGGKARSALATGASFEYTDSFTGLFGALDLVISNPVSYAILVAARVALSIATFALNIALAHD